jgi:hypothetical protein
MPLSLSTLTRLEKIAADNGFDLSHACEGDWLAFSSTQCPLRLWLTSLGDTVFIAALSQAHVARALSEHGTPLASPHPTGATAARAVTSIAALYALVRRAFQLSRTLPNELLRSFTERTASLPRSTEREQLVIARVGQEVFRDGLLEYWERRCAVTGLSETTLLRASHIKPWAECETDAERLDVFNGLLLAPHLDAAFDRGYITFDDDGMVQIASKLSASDRAILGLSDAQSVRLTSIAAGHRDYLAWHRSRVFLL